MSTLTTKTFELDSHELWLLQSALSDKVIQSHFAASHPCSSKSLLKSFENDRDEKFTLYKKMGGRGSLEDLMQIAESARSEIKLFEKSLKK